MTQQTWNFPIIYAGCETLRGHTGTLQALNEQTEAVLGKAVAAWQGEASEMYANEQRNLNHAHANFQMAASDYINAVEHATQNQEQQEAVNASSFG